MFTGLIRDIGMIRAVRDRQGARLLSIENSLKEIPGRGSSVAVDGVCLTVLKAEAGRFTAECYFATLEKTGLLNKRPGDRVHLEPALRMGDPLDGHLMQGHVSCQSRVLENRVVGRGRLLSLGIPAGKESEIIPEGSVGLNGVSLTVSSLLKGRFSVQLIGETLASTLLGRLKPGDRVNLETDLFLRPRGEGKSENHKTGITRQQLLQWGYV